MIHIIKNTVLIFAILFFCNLPAIAEPLFEYQTENSFENQAFKKNFGAQIGGGIVFLRPSLQARLYYKSDENWEFFILHDNNMPFMDLSNMLILDVIVGYKYYISHKNNLKTYINYGGGGGIVIAWSKHSVDAGGGPVPGILLGTGFDYMFNDFFGIYAEINTGIPSLLGANVGIRF